MYSSMFTIGGASTITEHFALLYIQYLLVSGNIFCLYKLTADYIKFPCFHEKMTIYCFNHHHKQKLWILKWNFH